MQQRKTFLNFCYLGSEAEALNLFVGIEPSPLPLPAFDYTETHIMKTCNDA